MRVFRTQSTILEKQCVSLSFSRSKQFMSVCVIFRLQLLLHDCKETVIVAACVRTCKKSLFVDNGLCTNPSEVYMVPEYLWFCEFCGFVQT